MPGFLADPFPTYRTLHEAGGLLWHARLGIWLVAGHAAAREVLRDDEGLYTITVGANLRRLGERSGRAFPALAGVFDTVPLLTNAPEHGPLRRYFAAIFAGKPMAAYVQIMREIVERLIADVRGRSRFDAVEDFADRLPPLFMARLLGFAEADLPALLEATNGMLVVFNRTLHVREYAALEPRAAQALAFFCAVAAERRRAPKDDGLSRMVATRFDERTPSDEQIARFAVVMFLVGVETTSTLIGSMIRLLIDNPRCDEELRAERSLLKPAIEETLRCEAPVQSAGRDVILAREIDGQPLTPGERMLVMIGAANRDPAAYAEPARFDPRRSGPAHLAFGEGPHVCVGATLSRTEAQVAMEALLALPRLRRAGADSWWPYDWMRRLKRLPVEFG